ncbi:tyrosine-protein kinase receptor torso-like [Periplaneta americana]|uniref:tyrosine-protein kinase receptor torso-like n=1 Tax=Periplaneta americana TaxID=6978 RepID=UPI0037E98FBB
MWCQILLVVMITNCAETLAQEDATSAAMLDFFTLAQCEARCYADEDIEDRTILQYSITEQQVYSKRTKECLRGLSISVDGSRCTQLCNGSAFCNQGCSCLGELRISEIRRYVRGESGPTAPRLHCREATIVTIMWESPGHPVFAIEMRQKDDMEWTPLNTTRRRLTTVHGLMSDVEYQFRVRAFSPEGQLGRAATSDWISTLNDTFTPGPVSDVKSVDTTLRPDGLGLQTTISWQPAWDRTCFYEVVCLPVTLFATNRHITMYEKFEFTWDMLEFGTNYSLGVRGKSEDETRESTSNAWLNFSTPDCLEYFQNDLTKCSPPKPYNVSAEEEATVCHNCSSQLYNVAISWATPFLQPTYYDVTLTRQDQNRSILDRKNVSGSLTSVMFPAMDIGFQYEVTVTAVSPAGPSDIASVVRTTAGYLVGIPTAYPNTTFSSLRPTWNTDFLWLVIFLPIFVLAATVCLYVYYRHGKRIRQERRSQYIETLDQKPSVPTECSDSMECDLNLDAKWEIPRENLLLGDVLGEGAFGIVRKGVLQEGDNWRDVAVKMLREDPTTEDLRQFRQEINMMQSVGRHPHIVSLIGCCTRAGRLRLVVEFCALGDLLNFLRKNCSDVTNSTRSGSSVKVSSQVKYSELLLQEKSAGDTDSVSPVPGVVVNQMYGYVNVNDDSIQQPKNQLTPADLLSFARQIAMGMEYLSINRVVHRDLAARNVLVCADKTIKISDFGLSRDVYEENVYRKKGSGRLPVKWMAFESLLQQVYTTQSDVWSFGILLWEIVTLGGNPYPGISTNKLFGLLRDGYRMECPANCSKELYDIMLACWQAKPKDRPTFVELHKMLDDLLENSSPQKYLSLNVINYKSTLKAIPTQYREPSFRNSGEYLNSNQDPASNSELSIPSSSLVEEKKYNKTPSLKNVITVLSMDTQNNKD